MRHLRILLLGALALGGALSLGGCVVVPRRPTPPPPPPGCWVVPGHYNANGYWVPAHCKR